MRTEAEGTERKTSWLKELHGRTKLKKYYSSWPEGFRAYLDGPVCRM